MSNHSNPKSKAGIPFEIEGEMTYLNPESAEGKALQRIDSVDLDDPTQWITVVEEGQEIDVDGALKRLPLAPNQRFDRAD